MNLQRKDEAYYLGSTLKYIKIIVKSEKKFPW